MSQQKISVARTDGPSEEEWTMHRSLLTRLYLKENKTLDQVMKIVANEHGFVAKKNQFETYLRDKWKLRKKTKASVWKAITPILSELRETGRSFELWIDGEKKPPQTYHKEIRRYRGSCHHLPLKIASNKLPVGVIIREVVSPTKKLSVTHIPFFVFEQYLNDSLPIIHARHPNRLTQSALVTDNAMVKSFDWDEHFSRTLQPVTLDARDYIGFSQVQRALHNPQIFSHPSHRSVMFSLANNCANLPTLPAVTIRWILRQALVDISPGTILQTTRHPSLAAMLKNLYKMSLENGDSAIVDFLLRQSIPGIEPDCTLASMEAYYGHSKPLDVAMNKRYCDLIEVLLRHGARPNEMTYYILNRSSRTDESAHTCEVRDWLRIYELLFEYGAAKDVEFVSMLVKQEGSRYSVTKLLTRSATSQYQTWISQGIFHDIFRYQNHGVMLQAAKIMVDHHLNLDQSCQVRPTGLWCILGRGLSAPAGLYSRALVDIVCYRGDLIVFKLLLEHGATVTASTLLQAILGGCKSIVQLMLDQDFDVKTIRGYWDVAMALAIQQDRSGLSQIILPYFSKTAERLGQSLRAAAIMGNWSLFENIYGMDAHLGGIECWNGTSYIPWKSGLTGIIATILSCSVRDGQDRITLQVLKKAGAFPDRYPFDINRQLSDRSSISSWVWEAEQGGKRVREDLECPLNEALKLRNMMMVSLLLDACAAKYRYHGMDDSCFTPLYHAVKWGDISVIKSIVNDSRKVDVRSNRQAFNAGVALGDLDMIYLLLDAGLEINSRLESDSIRSFDKEDITRTVLESAVQCENVKMLQCVLHAGADPHDARALWQAFRKEGPMLELVLQAHARVYPMGCRRWGREILMTTVKSCSLELLKKMTDAGADAEYVPNDKDIENLSSMKGSFVGIKSGDKLPLWEDFNRKISAFGYAIFMSAKTSIDSVEYLLQGKHKTKCGPETVVSTMSVDKISRSKTAFLVAIENGHIPTIELFMRHNADINYPARMHVRFTPLQQAADCGNVAIVQLLLEHGADINGLPARKGGGTALQLAAMRGYIRIVLLLLNGGADIHAPGAMCDGRTALEAAAEHGRLDIVDILLQRSDKFVTTYREDVNSATRYAKRNGHDGVVSSIEGYTSTNSQAFDDLFDFAAGEIEGSGMNVDRRSPTRSRK